MAHPTLLVIDGYSLLFRAFYGTRYLSTADGRPTNALFGFTTMLFNLLSQHQPEVVVIALDAHAPTFRHEEFAEYKGTRKETPQELVQQLLSCREYFAALGIPAIEFNGFEADDVVGTLSKQAIHNGYHTIIVSGDMDAAQLVDEHVTLITPKQGVTDVNVYDPAAVEARYGFGPVLVPDYKALVGDTSDNIPGIPGIGDKSATKLIQEFGTLESLLARLPEVEERYRKKIEPFVEEAPKYKRLATIVRDIPIEFGFEPLEISTEQLDQATAAMTALEFRTLAKKATTILGAYTKGREGAVKVVEKVEEPLSPVIGEPLTDRGQIEAWIGGQHFAVFLPPVVATNLLDGGEEATGYLAVGNEVRTAPRAAIVETYFAHPERAVGHDVKALYRGTGNLSTPGFDSMIAGYVLQSGRSTYDLRDLIQGYLDVPAPTTSEQMTLGLLMLREPMRERIAKEQQEKIFDEVELPLIPVLAEMEDAGIAVSRDFLQDFSKSLDVQIVQIQQHIFEMAGQEFLIASPKQLGEVLFVKMGIPGGKQTKTGWSTGAEILQEIDHPIIPEILGWRELTKLKSTYADALPRMIREDGRIHTTFNQTVAATGRLSSIDPNLQNIPIRTELGRQIRKAFVAAPGFELASLDYSQIELRLLAHLCRDEALVDAFQARVDVHTVTAALMFHVDKEAVTKEQRRLAKMLNYAVLYGVTEYGLKQQLGEGFSVSDASALIKQYFERFPRVKGFTEATVEEARQKGFTVTMLGRRRYFADIHAGNRNERLYAERQAVNAPIQGTAADLAKVAMLHVRKLLAGKQTRMLLQVHDELVFEMPPAEQDLIAPIRAAMEGAIPLDVPIEVDAKVGPNWNEMTGV